MIGGLAETDVEADRSTVEDAPRPGEELRIDADLLAAVPDGSREEQVASSNPRIDSAAEPRRDEEGRLDVVVRHRLP